MSGLLWGLGASPYSLVYPFEVFGILMLVCAGFLIPQAFGFAKERRKRPALRPVLALSLAAALVATGSWMRSMRESSWSTCHTDRGGTQEIVLEQSCFPHHCTSVFKLRKAFLFERSFGEAQALDIDCSSVSVNWGMRTIAWKSPAGPGGFKWSD